MKLLLCPDCYDVFKLNYEERHCKCGLVTGNYINNVDAVTNGRGISLAIGNGSLENGYFKMMNMGDNEDRKKYIKGATVLCWVRPNEGPGNPHTKVVK